MIITQTQDEIIIRLPKSLDVKELQRFLNYLTFKENTAKSKAKQEEVDEMARQINRTWWDRNKHRFGEQ